MTVGTRYRETHTSAVWEIVSYNPRSKGYEYKLRKVAGWNVGQVLDLTAGNLKENIEKRIYIKIEP